MGSLKIGTKIDFFPIHRFQLYFLINNIVMRIMIKRTTDIPSLSGNDYHILIIPS